MFADAAINHVSLAVTISVGVITIIAALWRAVVLISRAFKEPFDQMERKLDKHMDIEETLRKEEYEQVQSLATDLRKMWKSNHEAHMRIVEALAAGQSEPYYLLRADGTDLGPQGYEWVWSNHAYFELMDVTPAEARNHEYWFRLPDEDRERIQQTVEVAVASKERWEGTFDLLDRHGVLKGQAVASQVPIEAPDQATYFVGTVQLVDAKPLN